jgi:hypothetical protein
MQLKSTTSYRRVLLTACGLLLLWGCLGMADVRNWPYTGYRAPRNRTVIQVAAGGPADLAGMELGDVIERVDGIAVGNLGALARQPRPKPGEERTFEVLREGETLRLGLTVGSLPTSRAIVAYGQIAVGMLFLLCGVWAYLTVPGAATGLLAVLGLCMGASLGGGPYIESATVRVVVGAAGFALILLFLAVFLHFLLVFPAAKGKLTRRRYIAAIYVPAGVLALAGFLYLLVPQSGDSTIGALFLALTVVLPVAYLGLSLAAIVRRYVKATRQYRADSGLNLLLWGTVLGLGPSIVGLLTQLVAPQVVLPGRQYVFAAFFIIPVTFALAAMRAGRANRPAASTAPTDVGG